MPRLLLAALAVLFAANASAQLYRWVDAAGRVHYTDAPPATGAAKNVEQRKTSGNVVESSAQPYAVQQALKNFPVTLYTAANCDSPCKDARNHLTKRGVPFSEVSITEQKQLDDLKRSSGSDEVPVMLVGKSMVKGYEPGSYSAVLDGAGYPKTAASRPPASVVAKGTGSATEAVPQPAAGQPPAQAAPEPERPLGPYAPR